MRWCPQRFNIEITTDDGDICDKDIIMLDKGFQDASEIGLSIAQSKALLLRLQTEIINNQIDAYCRAHSHCEDCGRKLRSKGHSRIRYRTVFGDVKINSPRFYHCACEEHKALTFSPLTMLLSEHIAPEMLWLESKWASLVSYGASVDLLKDVLPVGDKLNAETLRRHLHKMARRIESELPEEKPHFMGAQNQLNNLPIPPRPMTVGLDGGYLRARAF